MNLQGPQAGFVPSDVAVLDWVGLGLVGVLIVLGLWRGLWWQVIRLVGILAAVAVARTFGTELAARVAERWPDLPPRVSYGSAWLALFLGVLLVATLLGVFGQRMLEAMQLGLANRLGGGAIGAITGIAIHVAVLIAICQLAPEAFVGRVVAGSYSERIVETVGDRWEVVIDGEAASEIERLLRPPADPGEAEKAPSDGR